MSPLPHWWRIIHQLSCCSPWWVVAFRCFCLSCLLRGPVHRLQPGRQPRLLHRWSLQLPTRHWRRHQEPDKCCWTRAHPPIRHASPVVQALPVWPSRWPWQQPLRSRWLHFYPGTRCRTWLQARRRLLLPQYEQWKINAKQTRQFITCFILLLKKSSQK